MAQVKNTLTGQVLNIPDDQIPFMSAQWQKVGADQAAPAPQPAPVPAPQPAPAQPQAQSQGQSGYPSASSPEEFTNTSVFYGSDVGTLFKDAVTGKMYYKSASNQFVPISSPSELQQLAADKKIKPGSEVGSTFNFAPSKSAQVQPQTQDQAPQQQPQAQPQPQQQPGQTGTVAPGDYKAQKDFLTKFGIDPSYLSALSDTQTGALYTIALYQDMQAKADAKIAPPSLSQADMDKYLADAKVSVDPTFAADLDVAKADLNMALGQISGDASYQAAAQAQTFQDQQKALGEQMAEAGLTYSGIRKDAEAKLKEQQKGIVHSQASTYQRQLQNLAGTFEKQYGTEALKAMNIPGMEYLGTTIAPPTPYNIPAGFATQEQAKMTAERQEQFRLAGKDLGYQAMMTAYGSKQPLA